MADEEQLLLDNLLDAFDRLHDGHTRVIDVQALLVATAKALPDSALAPDIAGAANLLMALVRSGRSELEQADAALGNLQPLRERLAEIL